ncbi:hypothetical protein KSP40_PGU012846 [Platanthera guangdongensis]|uniref:Uncharacterized protein n=1 Tax=Platanthera guangdongensis TaxID=2320717 RepID=A0ABR2LFH8_9ASPA
MRLLKCLELCSDISAAERHVTKKRKKMWVAVVGHEIEETGLVTAVETFVSESSRVKGRSSFPLFPFTFGLVIDAPLEWMRCCCCRFKKINILKRQWPSPAFVERRKQCPC